MNFADKKTVEKLRKEFPVGCRIVLDEMDDRQAPTIGTQGTCNGVDDAGNILVSWDTGSHLNVAYGADSCHRVATDAEVKVSLDRLGKTRPSWPARWPNAGSAARRHCCALICPNIWSVTPWHGSSARLRAMWATTRAAS